MPQTFVLKLTRELDLETGSAQGHIEEVKTGKALRFSSIDELLAFLENTMKQGRKHPEVRSQEPEELPKSP